MSAEWFYTQNGQQQGPITRDELKQLAQAGRLQPTDLIWKDGMPNWVQADSARGLFPAGAAQASAPTRAESAYVDDSRTRPSRRDSAYADDGEEYYGRRRPSRRRHQQGNPALLWGLIGGGVALLLVVGLVIILIAGRSGDNDKQANNNPPGQLPAQPQGNNPGQPPIGQQQNGNRRFALATNQKSTVHVMFEKGTWVEAKVTSTGRSDVDLHVYDSTGRLVGRDILLSSNCRVKFLVAKSQLYKLEVWNRKLVPDTTRNGFNSGTLTWTSTDANPIGNNPPVGGQKVLLTRNGQLANGGPTIDGGKFYQRYSVFLQANRTYRIDHVSRRFDCYLYLKDSKGTVIRRDDDGGVGLNSRIEYRPLRSGTYWIYATSLIGGQTGTFTVTVTER